MKVIDISLKSLSDGQEIIQRRHVFKCPSDSWIQLWSHLLGSGVREQHWFIIWVETIPGVLNLTRKAGEGNSKLDMSRTSSGNLIMFNTNVYLIWRTRLLFPRVKYHFNIRKKCFCVSRANLQQRGWKTEKSDAVVAELLCKQFNEVE